MSVKIITGSTNYLPKETLDKYDIKVVSLWINDGAHSTRETKMDFNDFYERLKDMENIPKSAQPSPEEMRAAFESALKDGHDVLGIFLSGQMSGTIATAHMIANDLREEYPDSKIVILDTESNSMQEGFAVLSAAEEAHRGEPIEKCVEAARATMLRSRFIFAPQTLEFLAKGGRIGRASSLLGSFLKIVPVLSVEDAVTTQLAKVRTFPRALDKMLEILKADIEAAGPIKRIVVHAISEEEVASTYRDERVAPLVKSNVDVVMIGPVIGAHVGPAVGICYELERPLRSSLKGL